MVSIAHHLHPPPPQSQTLRCKPWQYEDYMVTICFQFRISVGIGIQMVIIAHHLFKLKQMMNIWWQYGVYWLAVLDTYNWVGGGTKGEHCSLFSIEKKESKWWPYGDNMVNIFNMENGEQILLTILLYKIAKMFYECAKLSPIPYRKWWVKLTIRISPHSPVFSF